MTDKINGYHYWEILKVWQETPSRVFFRGAPRPSPELYPRHSAWRNGDLTIAEERHHGMTDDECWANHQQTPGHWAWYGNPNQRLSRTWSRNEFIDRVHSGKFVYAPPPAEPQPTFIPYAVETFPLDRMVSAIRHKSSTHQAMLIIRFASGGIVISAGGMSLDIIVWKDALENYIWADTGEPFGQKVGE